MKVTTLLGIGFAAIAASAVPALVLAQTQPEPARRVSSTDIAGEIVAIDDGDFLLNTTEGQVLVDADDRAVRRANFTVGEQLNVTGRYDDDSFEAYSVTRENGEVVFVWD
ncbi:hypothetical protein H6F88_22865 [Oculatella sp. FACHB-28]|uniref:hypothetical protein n=1 Tax=Oculatella sp. FACHB-28 TaxID=2692845 RepID=UPI001684F999|nr:hypothetical protein [Oculatella sp. FACHB-28]MBD2058807.1 hypothetical protein [Oculatella sp. FACHB-28]